MKNFFKSNNGDIHFGATKINGFVDCNEQEAEKLLKALNNKKLWRCTVCNDLYMGEIPPKQCPTCFAIDAYVEINEKEFREMIK
jgi:rubrerythrin